MIVSGEHVARFVSDRLGFGLCPPYTAIGVERDGVLTGGVILNCFEGANVHATAAGHGWSKDFLIALGEYVFGALGCERMTLTTESQKVATYAKRLGAVREGEMRNQFGKGRNGILLGVLRDEWKFARVRPN